MIQEIEGLIGTETVGLTGMAVVGPIVTETAARIVTHVTGDQTTEGKTGGQIAILETPVQGRIETTETVEIVETIEVLATHVTREGHTATPGSHVNRTDQVETGLQTGLDVQTEIDGTGTTIEREIDGTDEMDVNGTRKDVLIVQTKTGQKDVRGTSRSSRGVVVLQVGWYVHSMYSLRC